MALVYTPEAHLGSSCPDFRLLGVDGKTYSRGQFSSARALVVMFICNHCPYVKAVEDRILFLATQMQAKGAEFIAISSNDATDYPDDSYENLKKRWSEKNYSFPYLYDEDQQTAKAFGAVCTPDFFVFDHQHKMTYRGRLDDSWKDQSKVTREELKAAIEKTLKGESLHGQQHPSMGCSIKWKKT